MLIPSITTFAPDRYRLWRLSMTTPAICALPVIPGATDAIEGVVCAKIVGAGDGAVVATPAIAKKVPPILKRYTLDGSRAGPTKRQARRRSMVVSRRHPPPAIGF